MAEIEDIKSIIMGGVDQPILDPHNLMVNADKRHTIDELERQIGRLEHRNTYLKRENEQLEELTTSLGQACFLLVEKFRGASDDFCTFCGLIDSTLSVPYTAFPSYSSFTSTQFPSNTCLTT